jgi:hypothetical protein
MEDPKAIGLELRSARARRKHWLEEREVASITGDKKAQERAESFVREYEEFIAEIERAQTRLGSY